MKAKINKTNAVRLLDKAKIDYELIPYEVDENDLAAAHVAAQLGENIEQVFKTLVLHGDTGCRYRYGDLHGCRCRFRDESFYQQG